MIVEKQLISADAFYDMIQQPEFADRRVELVEGEIIEMSLPNPEHAEILSRLHARLAMHVYDNDLGRVAVGDVPFVVERNQDGRDTVRGLDLTFLSKNSAPQPLPRRALTIMPDLAVEVISPSNKAADIRLKIRQLLEAGAAMIWIVYTDMRIVDVYTGSGVTTLEASDTLSGGDVLPGFEIRVADIFPS